MTTHLATPFSAEAISRVLSVLDWAYGVNGDLWDPEIGHDEASFGFNLYKSISYRLPVAVHSVPGVLAERVEGSVVLRQNDAAMRIYRIGASESDDPWTSFPSNQGAAPAMASLNSIQLRMFSELDEPSSAPLVARSGLNFIVGHCGTATTGFRAAYLCLPVGVADDRVRRWQWLTPIYRIDVDGRPNTTVLEAAEPAAVQVEAPIVTLRPERRATESGNG